jgi:hypothetical protein
MERGTYHTSTIRNLQTPRTELEVRLTPNYLSMFNDSILESQVYSRLFGLSRVLFSEKNLTVILSIIILFNEKGPLTIRTLKDAYADFSKKFDHCRIDRVVEYMESFMANGPDRVYEVYERPWF